MTISGIIAEFNPFHNGHKYLLDQAEGLKIVAMSGNFCQRGEPAIVDKWTRAQMALDNGADIVVELPFLVAVQSADYFAQGAVDILHQLGVDQLVFGTEEWQSYQTVADTYAEKREEMEVFLADQPAYLSYPEKAQAMWKAFTGLEFSGDTPNHILAIAYAKAVAGTGIHLCPIQRQGAGFHSEDKVSQFASATAIRKHMDDKDFVRQVSPAADLLLGAPRVSWTDYFPLLRYQILTNPDLTDIYQVNEELASRLRSAIGTSETIEDLIEQVATKRYTKARVRRVLTYILVQAREAALPSSLRVLGFSPAGQAHLSTLKKSVSLVTRIGKEPWDQITQQADRVYQLGAPDLPEQNWGRTILKSDL
ncbi:nucleotidyltransferase [Streptococcus caprae]|uniref:tRNA(Met) cytidine acetate ligase n=1 Tax=Streptococcus caprae TaxID=1640501 RepID=A0ABV8CW56_9STRE